MIEGRRGLCNVRTDALLGSFSLEKSEEEYSRGIYTQPVNTGPTKH